MLFRSANYVVTGDILTGTGNTLTGIKIGNTDYKIPDDYAKPSGNYQNLSAGSATSAYSSYSANHATAADIATSAYINANTTSAMSAIVDELHGKLDSTAISDMLTKTEATQTYQPKGTYATETYTNEASANALSEAKTWVEGQDFLKNTDLTDYATKTYVDTASAAALSQSKSWVEQQKFVTSAYDFDANKQYTMTSTGWKEVEVSSIGDYLPLSGGTVSGELVVSGNNFDAQFLKLTRESVNAYSRVGLESNGELALKSYNGSGNSTQINVSPESNATNDKLVQVKRDEKDVGYLIPAKIHQGSYTPTSADGILHIVLES